MRAINNKKYMDNKQQVIVPKKLFSSMLESFMKWQKFEDELESFLLASDSAFISKMRQARKEHSQGKVKTLERLKKEI
jgi:hypothetical protein